MSTSPPLPPKEEVSSEIGKIASTLTGEMQNAALRKARELGFDLNRGRLSLEETLLNLNTIRDVLIDAAHKRKLVQLPLKLQYTLHAQAQKVSDALTALVNGTDAVQVLEDVVDDLTATAWQYNLHNLSEEVLGFQQKMNQLKAQETLIRKAHRAAEEFVGSKSRADALLTEINAAQGLASERLTELNRAMEQGATVLSRVSETEQKIAALAAQAEQHDTNATRHEENSKTASAIAQAIADKLPEIQVQVQTAKDALDARDQEAGQALATLQQSTNDLITQLQSTFNEVKATTEGDIIKLRDDLDRRAEETQTAAKQLLEKTASDLEQQRSDHDASLHTTRENITAQVQETISTLNKDTKAILDDVGNKFAAQQTAHQQEHNRLVDDLNTLEGQIKDSIRRATGFSLFHSFQKRQEDLVKSKNFWAKALATVVSISVALSIALIGYLHFNPSDFGPAFYLKLSISFPIIYAIWFCSVQYSRERRLEEEYAFKSNISISLEPYRELVEKLVVKDQPEELAKYTAFIIASVSRVFTSPTEAIFDHTKDATPAGDIIKASGNLAKDIIKVMK